MIPAEARARAPQQQEAARALFVDNLPAAQRAAGERRFDAAGARLHAALSSLYGDRPEFADWYARLLVAIAAAAAIRPASLQALDVQREDDPQWLSRAPPLGYSAYVDRFAGTLRGVRTRIPMLRALGVGYLHLLPFLRARAGDNDDGFAVASFEEVEPRLGDMQDLEDLAAALRADGILLCGDLVLNHVADDHPWAQAARAGNVRYRGFFHVLHDVAEVQACERDLHQVFPQTAPGNFTHVPAMGGWVWTTFYPYQWDLNYANPEVFAAMAAVLLDLANRGIEIFRLDSAPFLWKRRGTACINLPEVERVLVALRAVLDLAAPGTLLKAEAIMPTPDLARYFGSGDDAGHACHLAYHSGLMAASWAALARQDTALLRTQLRLTPALPSGCGWLSYVRCHDDIIWSVLEPERSRPDERAAIAAAARFLSGGPGSFAHGLSVRRADGEGVHGSNGMTASLVGLPEDPRQLADEQALARYALLYALAYWCGAVPLVYSGDELGQGNDAGSGETPPHATDGRWLQRPRYDETRLALAQVGQGTPAQTFALLQRLGAARRRLPASHHETHIEDCSGLDAAILLLARGAHSLAAFNFSAQPQVLDSGRAMAGDWRPLWPDVATAAPAEVTLPPWGCVWWVRA